MPSPMHADIITPNMSDSVDDLAAREKKLHDEYCKVAPVVDETEGESDPQ